MTMSTRSLASTPQPGSSGMRVPPSSFASKRNPPASLSFTATSLNPAPTPPPASPLPALPLGPSPMAETVSFFTTPSFTTVETRGFGHGIHDETINGAFLLDQARSPRPSSSKPRRSYASSKQTSTSTESSVLSKYKDETLSRSSDSYSAPTTSAPSPRTSMASDLLSLSQTSRSLHTLSKRFSDLSTDPFEFDRLMDDSVSRRSSRASKMAATTTPSATSTTFLALPPRQAASPDISSPRPDQRRRGLDLDATDRDLALESEKIKPSVAPVPRRSFSSRTSGVSERQSTVSSESTSTARGRPARSRMSAADSTPGPSPTVLAFSQPNEPSLDDGPLLASASNPRGSRPLTASRASNPRADECPSPDIDEIIATTARKSSARSRSRSRPSTALSRRSNPASGIIEEADPMPSLSTLASHHLRNPAVAASETGRRPLDDGMDDDDACSSFRPDSYYYSSEYHPPVVSQVDVDSWRKLSLPLEGRDVLVEEEDAGVSSDSSLDLHTPLPDLMVRAGILSPRSAVLGRSDLSNNVSPSKVTAEELAKGVRGKVISKKRLVRHRDGKMLGLGLGLTTGLGWSDSEDEDSPSPLRHQISQIILKKKHSTASLSSMTSNSNSSRFTSRRESLFSTTTASSSGSRRSSAAVGSGVSSKSTSSRGMTPSALHKSQSMAQMGNASVRSQPLSRQVSFGTSPHTVYNQHAPPAPPSSFSASKLASLSRPTSKSSLVSPHSSTSSLRLPSLTSSSHASTTRPRSSSATSSADVSPLTPSSTFSNVAEPSIVSLSNVGPSLGMLSEESSSEFGEKRQPTTKPQGASILRAPSSFSMHNTTTGATRPRNGSSGSNSHLQIHPPSAPHGSMPRSTSRTDFRPASAPKSAAAAQPSINFPQVRPRTTSTGTAGQTSGRMRTLSSTSSASAAPRPSLKSKTSSSSLRVQIPRSDIPPAVPPVPSPASPTSSCSAPSSRSLHPPSMTLGSLAFPSPPPLSPALVSMRMAQVQAASRKSSLGSSYSCHA